MSTAERIDREPDVAILSATQEGLGRCAQGALDDALLDRAARHVGAVWSEGSEIVKRGWHIPEGVTFERTKGYWLGKYDGCGVAFGPVSVDGALLLANEFGQDAFIYEGALYDVEDGKIVRIRYAEASLFGHRCLGQNGYTRFDDGSMLGYTYPDLSPLGEQRNEFVGDAAQYAMRPFPESWYPRPQHTSGLVTPPMQPTKLSSQDLKELADADS